MLVEGLIFLASLICLIFAANTVVDKAVLFEERLGVSKMIIGLTVLAVGTSLPELVISTSAVAIGHPKIALGTVIGSNVFNVCVVLGITAMATPVFCGGAAVRRNGIIMLAATYGFWLIGYKQHHLDRRTGMLFLGGFLVWIIYEVLSNEGELEEEAEFVGHDAEDEDDDEDEEEIEDDEGAATDDAENNQIAVVIPDPPEDKKAVNSEHILLAMAKAFAALIVLCYSSYFMVRSTMMVASSHLVGEYVISMVVNAFGTSLPELSVCIVAARRGESDIVVGNIIGSNISNILLVLGVSSILITMPLKPIIVRVDFPFIALSSTMMIAFLFQMRSISRLKGIMFFSIYLFFIWRCFKYPM